MATTLQNRRRIPAVVMVGVVAFALIGAIAPAHAEQGPDEPPEQQLSAEEVEDLLSQTVNDTLYETIAALEAAGIGGIGNEFPNHFAAWRVSDDGKTLEVFYNSTGDQVAVKALVTQVEKVASTAPMEVMAVAVDFDPAARSNLAQRISADAEGWADQLGLGGIGRVDFDTITGDVTIVATDETVTPSSIEIEGTPVSVVGDRGEVKFQNRAVDGAPWTGGAKLRFDTSSGGADCTLGFTWVRWDTSEVMGGTADHCYSLGGGNPYYYNGSALVGYRHFYSTARDSMLLRSSPQNQFRPSVFVGDAVTWDSRYVHSAVASPPVGTPIALSAARSGLHVGTILSSTTYSGGRGPFQYTTVSACLDGDSGGPWLTTLANGRAVAHGQHVGIIGSNCLYMQVTLISAALSATLATQP
jgi:hypothetical protein